MKTKLSFSTVLATLLILHNSEIFAVTYKDVVGSETDLLKIIGKVQEYQKGADGFLDLNKRNTSSNSQVLKAITEKEEELRHVRAGFVTEIRKFFGMEEQSSPGAVETLTAGVRNTINFLYASSSSAFASLVSRAPSAPASSSSTSSMPEMLAHSSDVQAAAHVVEGDTSHDLGTERAQAPETLAASVPQHDSGQSEIADIDLHKIANLRTKKSFQAALSGRFSKIRDELQAAKNMFPKEKFSRILGMKANIDNFSSTLDVLSKYYATRHDALRKAKEVDTTLGVHGYVFFKIEYKDAICATLAPDERFLRVYEASIKLLDAMRTTLGEGGTPFYGPVILDQDITFKEFQGYAAMLKEYDSFTDGSVANLLQRDNASSSSSSSLVDVASSLSDMRGKIGVIDEDDVVSTAARDLETLRLECTRLQNEISTARDEKSVVEKNLLAAREELSRASSQFNNELQAASDRLKTLEREKSADKDELACQKIMIDGLMGQIETLRAQGGKGTSVSSQIILTRGSPQATSSSSGSPSSYAGAVVAANSTFNMGSPAGGIGKFLLPKPKKP